MTSSPAATCSPAPPRPQPRRRDGLARLQAARARRRQAGAGFYRYKVGDIEVTVVTDGVNRFKLPDNFVTNVKADGRQGGAGRGAS